MDPVRPDIPGPDQPLRFEGRVAIVTGAGGGLGKAYALALGARGASVVVNDLGGTRSGDGADSKAADLVVEEIRAAGGKAAANYDSVEFGDRIVQTAISAFGRIDIVICNAGILRDKSFAKMEDRDWELVYKVHLQGTYSVLRAAWPHMREQQYGRCVVVCSSSGLFGNFGQANYGSCKMGILGLANTLAIEGRRRNILVNSIAPVAASRMTEDVLPPDLLGLLSPDAVAPLVLSLAHDTCPASGKVLEVGGGWHAALRWQRSRGIKIDPDKMTPEAVAEQWPTVDDFTDASNPDTTQASFEPILENLASVQGEAAAASGAGADGGADNGDFGPLDRQVAAAAGSGAGLSTTAAESAAILAASPLPALPAGNTGKSDAIDAARAVAAPLAPSRWRYEDRDAILYALSVGEATGAAAPGEEPRGLQYAYEMHPEGMLVQPTLGVIFAHATLGKVVSSPAFQFNPMMLLHGEQEIRFPLDESGRALPLPASASTTTHGKVSAVYDKGKGAVLVVDCATVEDGSGSPLAYNRSKLFVRGAGGFGGVRGPAAEPWVQPGRPADKTASLKTQSWQALLYRLMGDTNPLHADPSMAAAGGFDRPILHGLCTFGIAASAIVREFCGNDPCLLAGVRARFTRHVFPGETVVVSMWRTGPSTVVFSCAVAEDATRGPVLSSGVATLAPAAAAGTARL